MAAGAAALAAGCKRPDEEILANVTLEELPYVKIPEGLVPGVIQRYATALTLAGYGRGALVTSSEGRPIKVEGNPRHPASLGATDVFAQAEILALYDPDRSQAIRVAGEISDWPAFEQALGEHLAARVSGRGQGLRLLSGRIVSPTLLDQIEGLLKAYPNMRWHTFEPTEASDGETANVVYGKPLTLRPRFGDADVVAAFDADPLGCGPDQVRFGRELVDRRKRDRASARFYSVESGMTLTGAFADHRLAAHPDAIEAMVAALAAALGAPIARPELPQDHARFLRVVTKDLQARAGRGLVLLGPALSKNARALGVWINDRLGAPENAFDVDPRQAAAGTLPELADDIHAGKVEMLVILDSNPVATAPGDVEFGALVQRLPFRVHLGLYYDETAAASTWHLPMPHPLESWSDIASPDGVASIVQPLIRPLHESYSAHRLLAALAGEPPLSDYDRIRSTWRSRWGERNFDDRWRRALVEGVIADTGLEPAAKPAAKFPGWTPTAPQGGMSAIFRIDPSVFDGRFANNAWLQECPQPFSKAVWGNAVEMALADAKRLGIKEGDEVEVSVGKRALSGPMRLSNGIAPGVVQLSLGYGRTHAGSIGDGVGFNVAVLRTAASPWIARNVALRRIGPNGHLSPSTAGLFALPGKAEELAPEVEVGAAKASPPQPMASFFPPRPTPIGDPYAWAMVIDTGACIGCNACVVACQSENNVPSIGPDEVGWGRIMHWLRIDVYDHGSAPEPRPVFQPVPCMHCEAAPCEPVCPVEASVHDHEGLNVQVYNRCIGTRFCQSNCPYKVRRFNWFGYAAGQEYKNLGNALVKAANNPDVSVRDRGVMEKCTYCVQRISRARRLAERETRLIAEGEVVTACQAACPTRAIHFGNLVDPKSSVSELRRDPAHYVLLDQLHTRPRTTYLARLRNSNPELGGSA
jgi:molybdopterin-containing oxidoreductase family iron-sulfur binding subunit